jgi:Rad3-related DNA helicase
MVPELKELNLGAKFTEWRQQQREAVQQSLDTTERFLVQVQPTGSGKTLCYVAAATLRPGRTLILTSFKGLQDQLHREHGLFILMGRSSYQCRNVPKSTCDEGPCRVGAFCPYKLEVAYGYGCRYKQAVQRASARKIVVTNYSFWLSNAHRRKALGHFDYMVCDEAHIIPNYVLDFVGLTLRPKQVTSFVEWPRTGLEFDTYRNWFLRLKTVVDARVRDIKKHPDSVVNRSSLVKFSHRVAKADLITTDNWVIEHSGPMIKAGMIRPTDIVQSMLFADINKVLLTSATVDKHTCWQMGITEDNSTYAEYLSNFQADRRPIYSVPCVRVDFRWTPQMQSKWMAAIDKIIGQRLGINGIVHSVSYARCKYIMEHSQYAEFMMTHTSSTTRTAVEVFKQSTDKCILVSPSIVAGWDFPYDECRWQIICKVPFPDLRSAIDKARKAKDPDFGNLLAIQNLEQICGRGMRYVDDWCETIIIDDHFRWFYNKTKQWSHGWFQDAVKLVSCIPEPLNIYGNFEFVNS